MIWTTKSYWISTPKAERSASQDSARYCWTPSRWAFCGSTSSNFGLTAARAVLTQFGFAHGWRMAEAMQAEFKWDTEDDWRRAGTRFHALEGLSVLLAKGAQRPGAAGVSIKVKESSVNSGEHQEMRHN